MLTVTEDIQYITDGLDPDDFKDVKDDVRGIMILQQYRNNRFMHPRERCVTSDVWLGGTYGGRIIGIVHRVQVGAWAALYVATYTDSPAGVGVDLGEFSTLPAVKRAFKRHLNTL